MGAAETLITNLPQAIQFLLAVGILTAAFTTILKFWQMIRPNVKADIDSAKAELKADYGKQITGLEIETEKISDRVGKLEKEVASIDVGQINQRFDRMERKLDDLTNLLIQRMQK